MFDLFHLPIPLFYPYLIALAVVLILLLLGLRLLVTRSRPPGPEPSVDQFSPYELSYLKGGAGGLIKTAIFSLDMKGFLARASKEEITVADKPVESVPPLAEPDKTGTSPYRPLHNPTQSVLEPIEQVVLFHLRTLSRAPSAKQILSDDALKTKLAPSFEAIRRKLEQRGLTLGRRGTAFKVTRAGALLLLVGVTAYKCYVSSPYASFFWIIAITAAAAIAVMLTGRRLGISQRGKQLLKQARQAYSVPSAAAPAATATAADDEARPAPSPEVGGQLLMGVAVLGTVAVAGTAYAYYSDVFKADHAAYSSGCSGCSACGGCGSCSSCGGCGG